MRLDAYVRWLYLHSSICPWCETASFLFTWVVEPFRKWSSAPGCAARNRKRAIVCAVGASYCDTKFDCAMGNIICPLNHILNVSKNKAYLGAHISMDLSWNTTLRHWWWRNNNAGITSTAENFLLPPHKLVHCKKSWGLKNASLSWDASLSCRIFTSTMQRQTIKKKNY